MLKFTIFQSISDGDRKENDIWLCLNAMFINKIILADQQTLKQ